MCPGRRADTENEVPAERGIVYKKEKEEMIIYPSIEGLLYYAQAHLLLDDLDVVYVRNRILDELKLTDYEEYEVDYEAIEAMTAPDEVLNPIVNYAVENGIITDDQREYFGDKIMSLTMLRPSEVADMFDSLKAKSAKKAFDWLYDYSVKSDYVKSSRIARNKHWEAKGTKGKLEITINLSKPEKDNKAIAKALESKAGGYPKCNICRENIGYAGRGTYRATLRYVPLELNGEEWFWQFSPYAYFNQHGIAVNTEHTPMVVNTDTLKKLFDFIDGAPDYFKDYYAYYKTERGYAERSLNSNDGWNVTSALSFVNMTINNYSHEIRSAVLILHGEKAHSCYFSKDAFAKLTGDNKQLLIIPDAVHTDLYDRADIIPFDKLAAFYRKYLEV